MNYEVVLISEKGNMRRFRRQISRFDPNAIDADNDGVVQEGTPFKRPAAPRRRERRGSEPAQGRPVASFWNYNKPTVVDPFADLPEDEDDKKPEHRNWRDIQLKPKPGQIPVDDVVHTIKTDKVKRDQWYAFRDAVLDMMMEVRDDTSVDKDTRRGIAKLYSAINIAKPKIDNDGNLVLELSDLKRARILKGIQSMKKKKYEIPHMDIIFDMLESVEKKSALIPTGFQTGRPFDGVRYKSASLMRITISEQVGQNLRFNPLDRDSGFRQKGEMPRPRIDTKSIGRSIGGATRRSGRLITSRFDPNAVDADADGIVQDGTPFERPSTPSIIGGQKPIRGGLPEGKKKPQRKNNIMKAQADRKAMNFQIEKLRSTLRRVGDDYVPSWWNTKDSKEFSDKIKVASPEELSEIFARIYVERRSLMTSKVGRMPDGTVKVFADVPDKKTEKLDLMLKARGESVYREMFGRIVMRDVESGKTDDMKKRSKQFMDWYQNAADNADWYFEQSFKITRRKSRKKLGIDAPVNRRGTRWAEDPDFPSDSFDKVIESIETDLRRANPSISDQSARKRAEEIVRDADKRMGRQKPDKSPRTGGNRQVVNPEYAAAPSRRLARRNRESGFEGKRVEWRDSNVIGYSTATDHVPRRAHEEALKQMNDIIASNEKRFGTLKTQAEWKAAFRQIVPGADIDLLKKSTPLSEYENKVLHAYLNTFINNPQIRSFPITIQANDQQETLRGVGGSHYMRFNKNGTGRDTFEHIFRYAAYDDLVELNKNHSMSWATQAVLTGSPRPFGVNDGVTNQIVADFIDKRIDPQMTPSEFDKLYEEAVAFEGFITSLHEGGHGSHIAAMLIDKYGPSPKAADILRDVNNAYDSMSPTEQKRAVRNTLNSALGIAIGQAGEEASQPIRDLSMTGYDIRKLFMALQSGVPLTDQSIISGMNPSAAAIWRQVVAEERQNPGSFAARVALMNYAAEWSQTNIRIQSDMKFMESFINRVTNDPDIKNKNLNLFLDKFPMTSNGELDVKKLMDPNTVLFRTRNSSGGLSPYKFRDVYNTYTVKFLAHKEFQYNSLSDADKKVAEEALNKLSYYARTTRRYGPEWGKTHLEGLAELHAVGVLNVIGDTGYVRSGDIMDPVSKVKFTPDELRVMNTLLAWLKR